MYKDFPFSKLASILRAAHALGFESIRTFTVTNVLESWSGDIDTLTREAISHAAEAINLGRTCDVPLILKRAFYELIRSPTFGEDELQDGMVSSEDESDISLPLSGSRAPPERHLLKKDILKIMTARQHLQSEWIKLTLRLPVSEGFICAELDPCVSYNVGQEHWRSMIMDPDMYVAGLRDPICGIQYLADVDWYGRGYCGDCVDRRRSMLEAKRRELWSKLDEWLQL